MALHFFAATIRLAGKLSASTFFRLVDPALMLHELLLYSIQRIKYFYGILNILYLCITYIMSDLNFSTVSKDRIVQKNESSKLGTSLLFCR